MKNTLENKARFLANYQFSHVCFEGISNSRWNIDCCVIKGYFVDNGDRGKIHLKDVTPLELKSISLLTDEEKIYIIKWLEYTHVKFENPSPLELWNSRWLLQEHMSSGIVDYLRSQGYAVAYIGVSTEILQEIGWITIRNYN